MQHLICEHQVYDAIFVYPWTKVFMVTSGKATTKVSLELQIPFAALTFQCHGECTAYS